MIITNDYVIRWVEKYAQICRPDSIYWCNGSEEEYQNLIKQALAENILSPINQTEYPGSYVFHNHPNDADASSMKFYFCTEHEADKSDSFAWEQSNKMLSTMHEYLEDKMRGQVMYVVPYILGPENSPFARTGIQITDSLYVVLNLKKLSRMGNQAWRAIGDRDDFFKGIHLAGDLRLDKRMVVHFPEDDLVITLNTNYGGYAFQSKASYAMIMSSYHAMRESWLAEHMMILGIEAPNGSITYIAGAFPAYCGKSNLAFISPPLYAEGYRCFTVSDDSAWLHIGPDGRLWAINPEAGFFSVLDGTNQQTSPIVSEALHHDVLFSNVSVDEDAIPWWEKKEDGNIPDKLFDWQGMEWIKSIHQTNPFHRNARFSIEAEKLRSISKYWDAPTGVPISAIIFGGRSSHLDPLIREARTFEEGMLYGASLFAEKSGSIERNPFGIMKFLGGNFSDYLENWFHISRQLRELPRIFRVNWFLQNDNGEYIWPGYRENFRVLEWILKRLNNEVSAIESPIGLLPYLEDLNQVGLNCTGCLQRVLEFDVSLWLDEAHEVKQYLQQYNDVPQAIYDALDRSERMIREVSASS